MEKTKKINQILNAQIFLKGNILGHAGFITFLFLLMILATMINFSMEQILIMERKNTRELIHLKSEYTGKSSKLQYESKRIEVENRLKSLNSTLKAPVDPPKRVVIE